MLLIEMEKAGKGVKAKDLDLESLNLFGVPVEEEEK